MSQVRLGAAVCVSALLVALAASQASAATSATATQTVRFTNQQSVQLKLAPSVYNFGNVDPLATHTSAAGANIASVFSNGPWHIQVNGTGRFSDGGTPAKRIPDKRMTVSGNGGPPVVLSATATTIASGNATPQAGTAVPLVYALTLRWTDPVSSNAFSDTLTYTAYTP
jgi:hypothetical protein